MAGYSTILMAQALPKGERCADDDSPGLWRSGCEREQKCCSSTRVPSADTVWVVSEGLRALGRMQTSSLLHRRAAHKLREGLPVGHGGQALPVAGTDSRQLTSRIACSACSYAYIARHR